MKRILLAYDGGDPSRRALDTTIELADRFGATVGVISVVTVHATPLGADPWDDRRAHEAALREAQNLLREHGIEAELIEPYGDPARTIETVAAERRYDTIVLGSRGQGAVGRFFGGSVSGHVAAHADATVVVTH